MFITNKRGARPWIVGIVIAMIVLLLILIPRFTLDGKSIAPPPHTLPANGGAECGDGHCSGSESYRSCPEDCCGEENDQVRTSDDCCEGLTAVQDICEFEWPKEEGGATLPYIPPTPPSTEAVKEFPTGKAVAPPQEIPEKYCWFCVNCGNGICGKHETTENCGIDCAVCGNGVCESPNETYENCPEDCCAEAGYRNRAPVNCCEGLKKIDPCDVEPKPSYCMITMMQEACINCGNGICEEYETTKNCPQDCIVNATSCEELPSLDIDALDRNSQLAFQWKADTIVPNSDLYLRESDECIGEECNWGPKNLIAENYQPGSYNQYSIDMPQDNLKFYQIVSEVRIGPKEANCEPQCLFQGSESEGFYDPCAEPPKLLKYETCSEKKVYCCFIGTRSQGWYDQDCKQATPENLINYDTTCHLGAKLCEQKSDVLVKHTQELIQPQPSRIIGPRTSINWLNFVNIAGITTSDQLFKIGGSPVDYVAYWDAEKQQQFGTAEGDPLLKCEEVPKGGKGGVCWMERIFTGVFTMKPGHPYFVSLRVSSFKMTYVGKVPEHVTFELKKNEQQPPYNENYIVLPLDTKIKTAKDLCEAKADDGQDLMSDSDYIAYWDPMTQNRTIPAPNCFQIKRPNSPYNFNLNPGEVYLITVPRNENWTQI